MMIFKIEWIAHHIETASRYYRDAAAAAFANLPSEMDPGWDTIEDAVVAAVWDAFRIDSSKLFFDYDAKGDFVVFDWTTDAWPHEQSVIKIWYKAELIDND